MRVIRNGDIIKLKKIKTFNCNSCGCLFEADRTEYKIGSQYNETYYYTKCPFCGRDVYRGEQED